MNNCFFGKIAKTEQNYSFGIKKLFVHFFSLLLFPILKFNEINSFMNQKIVKNRNN